MEINKIKLHFLYPTHPTQLHLNLLSRLLIKKDSFHNFIAEALDIPEPFHYRWRKGEGLHFPYWEIFHTRKEGYE